MSMAFGVSILFLSINSVCVAKPLQEIVNTKAVPCGQIALAEANEWRFMHVCGEERNAHWGLYHQEALALPALAALKEVRRALVIGGADGGVATQLLKSSDVEKVVVVSSMTGISLLSRKHLPTMNLCFFDARFEHIVAEPKSWLASNSKEEISDFDLIVIERPYPGEMELTWDPPYDELKSRMTSRSLLVHYAASIWDMKRVHHVFERLSVVFEKVYAMQYSSIEQIPWHDIAFLAGIGSADVLNVDWSWWSGANISTVSYHPALHNALFVPAAILSRTLGLQLPSVPDIALSQTRIPAVFQNSSTPRSYIFNPEHTAGEVLCENRSQYQKMEVRRRDGYDFMNLDGDLQFTSVFGDFYHEIMVHPAMAALGRKGTRVLVLGGGDGGAATAVLRYPVEEVIHIEIDEMVVDASKKYFRDFAAGFDDPRHKLIIGDALKWVHEQSTGDAVKLFDLCIIDTTDDVLSSPWTLAFYQDLKRLLAPHGAAIQNLGSMGEWLLEHEKMHKEVFNQVYVMNCNSPEYPSPYLIGFMTDTLDPFAVDWAWWSSLQIDTIYYQPTLHGLLFELPLETKRFYASGEKSWEPYHGEHLRRLDKRTRLLKKQQASEKEL